MCFLDTAEDRIPTQRGSNSGIRPVLEQGASSSSSVDRPVPPPVPEKVISEEDYEPVSAGPSYMHLI